MQLSVVTGTYNRLPLLQDMMASARASIPLGMTYEFVITDGGSTDGTLDWLRRQPDVVLIEHGALLGLFKAFNDAAFAARGRYVVLANDDITFVGHALGNAVAYMEDHPECGMGAFTQSTPERRDWHVNYAPAQTPLGEQTSVVYGQVAIVPKWLGDHFGWWALPGATTYGGDTWLSCKLWEAGYPVHQLHDSKLVDKVHPDALREKNNAAGKVGKAHPDSTAFYTVYPKGPVIGTEPTWGLKADSRPYRILYAPIYENGHAAQKVQKRSMRRALSRYGVVREVDYVNGESILDAMKQWRPDLFLSEFHDAAHFPPLQAQLARQWLPEAVFVNWHGDYWLNMASDPASLEMLKVFDLNTVVNTEMIPLFEAAGIPTRYWQIGYEETGVGHEPDATTPAYDVLFMASAYSEKRIALGRFLRSLSGVRVGLFGMGWERYAPPKDGETLYDFETGCKLIQNAKIVIADSQWPHATGYCSNRTLQSLAAGGAALFQQWFDGHDTLNGWKDMEHMVIWYEFADLEAKIRYFLDPANEGARAKIARTGHLFTLQNHSFDARLRELWAMLPAVLIDPEPEPELLFDGTEGDD